MMSAPEEPRTCVEVDGYQVAAQITGGGLPTNASHARRSRADPPARPDPLRPGLGGHRLAPQPIYASIPTRSAQPAGNASSPPHVAGVAAHERLGGRARVGSSSARPPAQTPQRGRPSSLSEQRSTRSLAPDPRAQVAPGQSLVHVAIPSLADGPCRAEPKRLEVHRDPQQRIDLLDHRGVG